MLSVSLNPQTGRGLMTRRLIFRSKIVLKADDGLQNKEIANELHVRPRLSPCGAPVSSLTASMAYRRTLPAGKKPKNISRESIG